MLQKMHRRSWRRHWKPVGRGWCGPFRWLAIFPVRTGSQGLLLAAFLGFLLGEQGFLARFFGFAGLACQGFLDGLEHLGQVRLVLLAGLQLLVAIFHVAVELGQYLLAFAALGIQRLAARVEVGALRQQLFLLAGNVLLDVGQLAQRFIEGLELVEARLAQVVVISEGAGELLRVLLVEQQLEVFLAAVVLVGRTGLDGNQPLLFNAGALEFFSVSRRSSSPSVF